MMWEGGEEVMDEEAEVEVRAYSRGLFRRRVQLGQFRTKRAMSSLGTLCNAGLVSCLVAQRSALGVDSSSRKEVKKRCN